MTDHFHGMGVIKTRENAIENHEISLRVERLRDGSVTLTILALRNVDIYPQAVITLDVEESEKLRGFMAWL